MNAFRTYFLDVIKHHYCDFKGRADRKQFWIFALIYFFIYAALVVLTLVTPQIGEFFAILNTLLSLALGIPFLALSARRLHDTNRSAWWLLMNLLPIIGQIVLLVFFLQPGTPEAKRFGNAE